MTPAEALATRLADPSPEVRRRAVRELADLADDISRPLILSALGDADWRVRKEAVALFEGASVSAATGSALIGAIEQEENVGLRNAAAEALALTEGLAIDLVLARLPALEGTSRKIALEILGHSSDMRRERILVEHLESDDVNLGAEAAELLGDIGGEGVVVALSKCLTRRSQIVVLAALQSLNRLNARVPFDKLEPLLATPLYGSELLTALGRSGDPAAAHVILSRVFADPFAARALVVLHDFSEHAAAAVEGAIGVSGAKVMEALTRVAASSDFADRYAAVSCLLWARRTEHVPLLVGLAQNESLHARILEGLSAWGAPAIEALDSMLSHAQGRMLASVIGLLGRLLDDEGGRRRIVLFTAYLSSADIVVATASMGALGRFGDEAIVPRLLELSAVDDPRARRAAGRALAQIGARHPDAVRRAIGKPRFDSERGIELLRVFETVGTLEDAPTIAAALTSPSSGIRRAALSALAAVAGEGAIDAISLAMTDESAEVREAAAAALSKLGPAASEMIVSALSGAKGPLCAALVRALGRVGHPEAPAILRGTARESAQTAIASLEASVRLGLDPRELMDELLSHPDAEVVKMALIAFGDFATEGELFALLSAPSWDVRLSAVEGLARRTDRREAIKDALGAALSREDNDLVRAAIARALAALSGKGGA